MRPFWNAWHGAQFQNGRGCRIFSARGELLAQDGAVVFSADQLSEYRWWVKVNVLRSSSE